MVWVCVWWWGYNHRPKDEKQNSKTITIKYPYDKQNTQQHKKVDNFIPKFKLYIIQDTNKQQQQNRWLGEDQDIQTVLLVSG